MGSCSRYGDGMVAPLRQVPVASWALALLWSLAFTSTSQAALPHVDDCFLCRKCYTGRPSGRHLLQQGAFVGQGFDLGQTSTALTGASNDGASGLSGAMVGGSVTDQSSTGLSGASTEGMGTFAGGMLENGLEGRTLEGSKEEMYVPPGFKFQIMPPRDDIPIKSAKRNCSECWGCDTQIEPLSAVVTTALGQNMKAEVGASPEWLFLADLPDTPKTGKRAVVKVWCMPIDKVHGTFSWRCTNTGEGSKAVQFLMAQQKVMEECGLMDVTIKVWPGRVNAVVPGHGLHVWWDGLWMERAEGLSLNQLSYKRTRSFVRGSLKAVLGDRLNRTRVVRAAIYDLLSSQCDRHSQNVFITEDGQIKLIDNLQALQFSWLNCATDSIFLPGTQKSMVIRWGGNMAFKVRNAKLRQTLNPMTVLDYRCYVKDGRIGTDYDPQLRKCLTKLSKMTAKEVQLEYGFPYSSSAAILQQRASDMLNKGFEWTLRYGNPRNYKPKAYRPQAPCCAFNATDKGQIFCAHKWVNKVELPYGDPISGGEWKRPYPDPGTHVGGTYTDWPPEK